jgi:hypothetical protein
MASRASILHGDAGGTASTSLGDAQEGRCESIRTPRRPCVWKAVKSGHSQTRVKLVAFLVNGQIESTFGSEIAGDTLG